MTLVTIVDEATYPLDWVKQFIKRNLWMVTLAAQTCALDLGLDEEDICDCILNHLGETHFYKTMPAEKRPGLMQDVYRITYEGHHIYLKLQVENDWAAVISFKKEE